MQAVPFVPFYPIPTRNMEQRFHIDSDHVLIFYSARKNRSESIYKQIWLNAQLVISKKIYSNFISRIILMKTTLREDSPKKSKMVGHLGVRDMP